MLYDCLEVDIWSCGVVLSAHLRTRLWTRLDAFKKGLSSLQVSLRAELRDYAAARGIFPLLQPAQVSKRDMQQKGEVRTALRKPSLRRRERSELVPEDQARKLHHPRARPLPRWLKKKPVFLFI